MDNNTLYLSRKLPPAGSEIYLMGICGTGMAALAGLLLDMGYRVRGSDSAAYPPMSVVIKKLGIPISIGYSAENLKDRHGNLPDLVVIGNVITARNVEARFVLDNHIPYLSFPQAIADFFLQDRKSLVVAGTHGKTTTSTMLVSAIDAGCGLEPGFMIGGMLQGYDAGFRRGRPPWFVIEGDEYDTAFFDKGPKFLHYRPYGAILTSVEFDHADIFTDMEAVRNAFRKFVEIIPANGLIVACSLWKDVRTVCSNAKTRVIWYGTAIEDHWQLRDVETDLGGTRFRAFRHNSHVVDIDIRSPGMHNALNALSVLALCTELGMDPHKVARGLSMCQGVRRRQEVIGECRGITVIDDFAHHPSAVKVTIEALKAKYQGRRLVVVFEPRTNTSRRAVFQKRYATAFDMADMVLVRAVPDPDKAPEGDRFSSERLVDDLKARGIDARFMSDAQAIVQELAHTARSGDVIAILSNGDFEGLHHRLLEALEDKCEHEKET